MEPLTVADMVAIGVLAFVGLASVPLIVLDGLRLIRQYQKRRG